MGAASGRSTRRRRASEVVGERARRQRQASTGRTGPAGRPEEESSNQPQVVNREDSVATTVAPTPRLWQQKSAQIAAALVFGATILPLGQFAFKQVHELWQGRQPQADRRLVSSLRVGVLFDDFQEKFGHKPNARLTAVEGYRRYLFVLDNAYVQAFVGDDDTVAVYGVIMKDGEKSNPIAVPGGLGDVRTPDMACLLELVSPYVARLSGVSFPRFLPLSLR